MINKLNKAKLNKSPEPVMPVSEPTPGLRILSPEREADFLADLLGSSLASHMYQVRPEGHPAWLAEELTVTATNNHDPSVVLAALLSLVVKLKSSFHGIRLSDEASKTIDKIVREAGLGVEKLQQDHIQQVRDVMKQSFPALQAALMAKGITARRDDAGLLVSRDGKKVSPEDMQAVSDLVRTMVKEKEKETA